MIIQRMRVWVAVLAATVGTSAARAQDLDQSQADKDGSHALAERLAAMGHQTLRLSAPATGYPEAEQLFRAAVKLDSKEPRFARSLVDILREMHAPGEAAALRTYVDLVPDDQAAQVELIDLNLSRMENADQKIAYCKALLAKTPIPAPVRSAVAERCAVLLVARGQQTDAIHMLDTSLTLNTTNLEAMNLRYQLTISTAVPMDRVNQLLAIMRANPANPPVSSQIAEALANLGLVTQSMNWFNFASGLYGRTNTRPDAEFARGAAAELLIADRPEDCEHLAQQYLDVSPGDADAWFILLSATRYKLAHANGDKTAITANDDAIRHASNALFDSLAEVRQAAGEKSATTRPVDAPVLTATLDLSGDLDRLRHSGKWSLADDYISAASSLAWLDLYYRRDPEAADPLLSVLGKLLAPDDPQLLRLEGWRKWLVSDIKGAQAALTPIAARDPLAKMGLILMALKNPAQHTRALADANALVNNHPSGRIGATLWSEFEPLGASITTSSEAAGVATQVDFVSKQFLPILDNAQQYYVIRADPVKPSFQFGEPILVHVVMQNISNDDLAIGPNSEVHPNLWFDAYVRLPFEREITGAAIDSLDQRLVLAPGESVSAIARVDEDALYPIFLSNPMQDLTINMMIVTNPTNVTAAGAQPGMCGFRTELNGLIQRDPTPIDTPEARQALLAQLDSGDGGDQIRVLQVLASYVQEIREHPEAQSSGGEGIIDQFAQGIGRMTRSSQPSVSAWAACMQAMLAQNDAQMAELNDMASDANWETRLLALLASRPLGAQAQPLVKKLAGDSDPIVAGYASADLRQLAASTSQPSAPATTQPILPVSNQ